MNPEANLPAPEVSEAEETQLCLSCLTPNPVLGHFCRQCGAPISPYAATAPFESAFAEGFALRRAVESPKNGIVLAGVLAYAGSTAVIGLVMLATFGSGWNAGWLLGLGLVVFAAALGIRTLLHWRQRR